jgi:hypothetical protein
MPKRIIAAARKTKDKIQVRNGHHTPLSSTIDKNTLTYEIFQTIELTSMTT